MPMACFHMTMYLGHNFAQKKESCDFFNACLSVIWFVFILCMCNKALILCVPMGNSEFVSLESQCFLRGS